MRTITILLCLMISCEIISAQKIHIFEIRDSFVLGKTHRLSLEQFHPDTAKKKTGKSRFEKTVIDTAVLRKASQNKVPWNERSTNKQYFVKPTVNRPF